MIVKYSDGTPDEAFTIDNGSTKTYTREIKAGVEVTLEWAKGPYDFECSFMVKSDNGRLIFTQGIDFANGFLFSWVNNCSTQNLSYNMCDGVQNLEYVESTNLPIELVWEAPVSGDVIQYEVYRNARFLGTTETLSYTDETATGSFTYTYSVRPVYADCFGYLSDIEVSFTQNIMENNAARAIVYPNPSNNDFTIVCNNMTRISVFNMMGSVIMDTQVNDSRYTIRNLNTGVYFINIETSNGNIVKKIVKL